MKMGDKNYPPFDPAAFLRASDLAAELLKWSLKKPFLFREILRTPYFAFSMGAQSSALFQKRESRPLSHFSSQAISSARSRWEQHLAGVRQQLRP